MADTVWFPRRAGQFTGTMDVAETDEEGVLLMGDLRVPDRCVIPDELGGGQARIVGNRRAPCPCGSGHDVLHFDLDVGDLHVAECPETGFMWYQQASGARPFADVAFDLADELGKVAAPDDLPQWRDIQARVIALLPGPISIVGTDQSFSAAPDLDFKGAQAAVGGLVELVYAPGVDRQARGDALENLAGAGAPTGTAGLAEWAREPCPKISHLVVLVNEEGLIHGLAGNAFASAISGQPLVGPAVVLVGPDAIRQVLGEGIGAIVDVDEEG